VTEAVSSGGVEGGLSLVVAVDSRAVYYIALNLGRAKFILSNDTTITGSAFGAVSITDGSALWQAAAPRNLLSVVAPLVVNNLVLTGLNDSDNDTLGSILELNKYTG
jgi:hypothetical protein